MKIFIGRWVLIPALLLVGAVACSSSPGTSPATYKSSTTVGGTVGIALTQWAVTPTTATISAGSVTFNVTNNGNIPHEFVVLRTDTPARDIKIGSYENVADRIDEKLAGTHNVGETGDLETGASKALTITLTPGHYVFVCNLPSHFRLGMHFDFTVS